MSDGIEPSQPHLCTELYLHRHNWLGCYNWFTVGILRFELRTSCSQSRHTNRTVLHPEFSGFYKLVLIFLLTLIMFLPRFKFIVNIPENCFIVPPRIKFTVPAYEAGETSNLAATWASNRNRTDISTLEGSYTNRCTILAKFMWDWRDSNPLSHKHHIYSVARLSNCGAIPSSLKLPRLDSNQQPTD